MSLLIDLIKRISFFLKKYVHKLTHVRVILDRLLPVRKPAPNNRKIEKLICDRNRSRVLVF